MSEALHDHQAALCGRPEQSELAKTVAHVTFAMHEALAEVPEATLAGGYRYHLFSGFPGFCDHAAEAGLIFHHIAWSLEIDQWLECVDDFATRVIDHAQANRATASRPAIARHAEAILNSPRWIGLARSRRPQRD